MELFSEPPAPAYLESRRPWLSYGWTPLRAVRHGTWKLIAAPRPELYDLSNDPKESSVNLIDQERRKARELQALPRGGNDADAVEHWFKLASLQAEPRLRARAEADPRLSGLIP